MLRGTQSVQWGNRQEIVRDKDLKPEKLIEVELLVVKEVQMLDFILQVDTPQDSISTEKPPGAEIQPD